MVALLFLSLLFGMFAATFLTSYTDSLPWIFQALGSATSLAVFLTEVVCAGVMWSMVGRYMTFVEKKDANVTEQ